MVATPREAVPASEAEQTVPFPYGWRYVERTRPNGSIVIEQVPLTLEDVLHPQEGDQVTHSDLHQRICVYLFNVFRGLLAAMPSAVVLHDVRVTWDVPGLKGHGPDLAVIFDVRERKNWSTFDVAEEGVRPALIVEVTSPETRHLDLTNKLEEYDLAGVPLYVIVDLVRRAGQIMPRLIGYRQTPTIYEVLPPDERGRLWLEPLNIWLGLLDQQVVCYDEAGNPLGDYLDLQAALAAEMEARAAEAEARAAAEQRIQELEAELRRLRGEARPNH
jgi:Uma2 family endonuclease